MPKSKTTICKTKNRMDGDSSIESKKLNTYSEKELVHNVVSQII